MIMFYCDGHQLVPESVCDSLTSCVVYGILSQYMLSVPSLWRAVLLSAHLSVTGNQSATVKRYVTVLMGFMSVE